jgi:uncharacterized membrane protein
MKPEGSVAIEQRIEAPAESVAAYVGDFRNAKEWMVGVEGVEPLSGDSYRLILESPVGKIEPEARVVEHGDGLIRWVYTSILEGGGEITVAPVEGGSSCIVHYTGDFRLKGKILDRAARFVGIERFARKNGERSLLRLKHLMEARRY